MTLLTLLTKMGHSIEVGDFEGHATLEFAMAHKCQIGMSFSLPVPIPPPNQQAHYFSHHRACV